VSFDRRFRCAPESVPEARRFAVDTLPGLPTDVLDIIVLLVSELTTNCVLHAQTDFEVSIDRTDSEVRVAVTDTGAGAPEVQWPPVSEPHGRGLHIVDELSDEWGVSASTGRSTGKTVWFAVNVPMHANDLETAS